MSKSELVTAFEKSLPAELRSKMAEQVAADLARLGNTGGKDTIRVLQDKTFQMPDDTIAPGPLELVIVDFVYRNEYYTEAFNRKDIKAPACFAVHPEQKMLVPTTNSPKMQVAPGESCNKCQWDKFGSSPNGDGKACKNTIYMTVLPTDATEDSPLCVIKTSPTAINPFNNHVAKVGRTVQLPLWAVTTKVFFDPNVTYASTLLALTQLLK
jgi:hypothetical protein